jgi:hypothetical protein
MIKKLALPVVAIVAFVAGTAFAAKVRDWHDLNAARGHLHQVVVELGRARSRNNYDMQGHGAKAEDLAKQAENEIGMAIDAIKSEHH